MNRNNIELFTSLAKANAGTAAELWKKYTEEGNDTQQAISEKLYRDYTALAEKIHSTGDCYLPTKADIAMLSIAATVAIGQIQNTIASMEKLLECYKQVIIPRFNDILDRAADDNEAGQMANEYF